MERQDFAFNSCGDKLVGNLFLPRQQPIAAIVTTGPLTSVKEQAAGRYARALAERGFAALAFDHRYFGGSDGKPRQFENPRAKVDDIRAAVSALQNDNRIQGLPIMAVGICGVEDTWRLPYRRKIVCAHSPASQAFTLIRRQHVNG